MRKVITIAILIVLAVLPLAATTTYPAVAHYMIGRVDTVVEFNIEMLEEVLPFDLEGADVAYNSNYASSISGLKIGTYSIVSNRRDFNLTVTHDDFKLVGGYLESDHTTHIGYRLYMILNFDTKYFKSALTGESIVVMGTDTGVWPEGDDGNPLLLIRDGIFVSLDDGNGTTATTLSNLKDGDYSSTVSFTLTVD